MPKQIQKSAETPDNDFETELHEMVEQVSPTEKQKIPEQESTQEQRLEKVSEQEDVTKKQEGEQEPIVTPTSQAEPVVSDKTETAKKIENVLAEDLDQLFLELDSEAQMAFKQGGEQAAQEIEGLLQKAKVKVKEIIEVIRKWLILLPGVNKFFIEKEAKIKAEKILKIKEENKN